MIILDTNVVSEVLKQEAAERVMSWLDNQDADELVITAITKAELLYGLAQLPDGRRKRELSDGIRAVLHGYDDGGILPFDSAAADKYGDIVSTRESAGTPIGTLDAQIAAICGSTSGTLATRNVKDFDGLDLSLVNPWLD